MSKELVRRRLAVLAVIVVLVPIAPALATEGAACGELTATPGPAGLRLVAPGGVGVAFDLRLSTNSGSDRVLRQLSLEPAAGNTALPSEIASLALFAGGAHVGASTLDSDGRAVFGGLHLLLPRTSGTPLLLEVRATAASLVTPGHVLDLRAPVAGVLVIKDGQHEACFAAPTESAAALQLDRGPPVALAVRPLDPALVIGQTRLFTAQTLDAHGNPGPATPSWSASCGSIDAAGLYTAPAAPTTCTVTATQDGLTGQSVAAVVPGPSVLRTPAFMALGTNDALPVPWTALDAQGEPFVDPPLAWSILEGSAGTMAQDAVFHSGASPGAVKVRVQSGTASSTTWVLVSDMCPAAGSSSDAAPFVSTNDLGSGLTATNYVLGLACAGADARVNLAGGSGDLVSALVDIDEASSDLAVRLRTQPGDINTAPEGVNKADLQSFSQGTTLFALPGLFLSVDAWAAGERLDSAGLNALLGDMTVRFRVPATYFLGNGLQPSELRIAKYSDGTRVRSDLTATLLTPSPVGGFYEFEAVLPQFSSFAIFWGGSTSSGGGGGAPAGNSATLFTVFEPTVTSTGGVTQAVATVAATAGQTILIPLDRANPALGSLILELAGPLASSDVILEVSRLALPGESPLPGNLRGVLHLDLRVDGPLGAVGQARLVFVATPSDLQGQGSDRVRLLGADGALWAPIALTPIGRTDLGDRFEATLATSLGRFVVAVEPAPELLSPSSTSGIVPESPPKDGFTATARPLVTARIPATADPGSARVWLDGQALSGATASAGSLRAPVFRDLADGAHSVRVQVTDGVGQVTETTWAFTVDTAPPTIGGLEPKDGSTVGLRPTLRATLRDALSGLDPARVRLTLDGKQVPVGLTEDGFAFQPTEDLAPGRHAAELEVADQAGNPATQSWAFTTQAGGTPAAGGGALLGVVVALVVVGAAGAVLAHRKGLFKGPGKPPS